MQDFSKEEFGLLGASVVGSDKDLLPTGVVGVQPSQHLASHIHHGGVHPGLAHHVHVVGNGSSSSGVVVVDDIKPGDLIEAGDVGKLDSEVDRDLYPWSTIGHHIGSQFLRSSDDPLISGGTNDNQNDNELSVATASHQSMCSSPTPPPVPQKPRHDRNTIRVPASILSPELPPDTPESPLPTPPPPRGGRRGGGGGRQRRKGPIKLRFHHQALPPEYLDHYEATQNLTAKREQLQLQQQQQQQNQQSRKMERQVAHDREDRTNESVRNWLQKILELQKEGVSLAPIKDDIEANGESTTAPKIARNKVVSYTDLPYMGEMTLENSKPRRGRKPKKADICHLIYKNYGTILSGTPKPESIQERVHNGNRTQTRSSSLLERRLTEKGLIAENGKGKREEPLNLCVRDGGTDPLALSSSDEESDFVVDSACHTPIIAPSDISTDLALAETMKMSLPNLQSTAASSSGETPSTAETPPGGYMYWPNVGGFIHPMALYYQKLVDSNNGQSSSSTTTNSVPSTPNDPTKPSTASSTNSTPPPPTTPSSPAPTSTTPKPHQTLVPKPISQLIKPEKTPTSTTKHSPPTQKRKRSAIFIPPVPAENSTNPATEVSICKFKFTGGAKPCLQEKKMLSVDSGGNFRYYSGTGDKSMRGYEFFPRESLQQSSLHATTTTGAFLNTPPVEKITCDLPPPSLGLSNDILQIPDFPSATTGLVSPGVTSGFHRSGFRSAESAEARRARRRSRRSTQRESLEKTFKEKGFLIQTQQLQSAEGATYCKFRQLRKFTRYLFRSWKDYLPGELQQQQQQPAGELGGPGGGELPHDGLSLMGDEDEDLLESSPARTPTGTEVEEHGHDGPNR
ncbi:uncharacterized protein LOC6043551 isoform X3 [Culex quinquefasciatus]|nr:uncharacterized protein LOC6043551 isoform X3 [Culex quinquefasciatus]